MPAIQFYGLKQVMQAAENMDCPAWAIFVSRQLFMKFEGGTVTDSLAFLDSALQLLSENETTGIYTIKFFETDGENKIKINEKTVCTAGSFNFKLVNPEDRAVVQYGGQIGYTRNLRETESNVEKLMQIVSEQQQMLATIIQNQNEILNGEDEHDEPDEPQTLTGVLIDTLKDPQKLQPYIGMIKQLFSTPQIPNYPAASIGSTGVYTGGNMAETTTQPGQQQYSEEEQNKRIDRLGAAIDYLSSVDPQFLEHLEQLVELEKKKPGKLLSLLSWL